MMSRLISRKRAGTVAGTLAMVLALNACDTLLEVENPGEIEDTAINDPSLIKPMVNGVVNEFQRDFSFLVFAGAILGDEALNGHNFSQWREFDLREVLDDNSQLLSIYQAVQRPRAMGDEMALRMRPMVDEAKSMDLATVLTYGGYAYVYLAEYFCFAPVAADGEALRSEAIAAIAVQRFQEAIAITQQNTGAEAVRIRNLALVGAARASLLQDKNQEAIAFASQVPAGYVEWVRHVDSPTNLRNYLQGATSGTNRTIGLDPSFLGLNDRRVRHDATGRTGHNQQTILFTPFQGSSYGEWEMEGPSRTIATTTPIRLASGLEARYIIAEAGGMNDVELLAFINERRAVGGQEPFVGADLQAELRDQRRRDFFLDGHRLGDLRRYRTRDGIDMFPSGPHPNDATWGWGPYGTATCFVPHRNEGIGNPNYKPLPLD
jgi:starch-binding outer membrane protein, SusD/RagB family